MRRAILIGGVILLILLFLAPTAISAEHYQVRFPEAVWVGGVLLPAGEYAVHHTLSGGKHVMDFVRRDAPRPARATASCHEVQRSEPIAHTLVGYRLNDKQERVLTQLAFAGESVEHRF